MKNKVCKECKQEYSGKEYFQHQHGKNNANYKHGETRKRKKFIYKNL